MTVLHAFYWFGGVLIVVAILNRLLTDKQVPGLLDDSISAVANIFKGVFRG